MYRTSIPNRYKNTSRKWRDWRRFTGWKHRGG
jgi:hypothetical protein